MTQFTVVKDTVTCWAVVAHSFNTSTQEAEAGGSLCVRGQPGLQEVVPGQNPKLQRNPVSKTKQNKILFYS